jgi:hypothetical protein
MKPLLKFAPYFGVISAALIFLSWLVSTGAVAAAEGLQKTLSDAKSSHEQFRRYSELTLGISNLNKQLNRIELARNHENQQIDVAHETLSRAGDALQWIDSSAADIYRLRGYADSVKSFSDNLPASSSARRESKQIYEKVIAAANAFYSEGEHWRTKFGQLTDGKMGYSLTNPPSNWREIGQAAEAHSASSRKLAVSYLPLMNELHRSFENAQIEVEALVSSASRWATISRWLNYGIFGFGTFLSIYGKLLEVREKAKARAKALVSDA